jgi:hypothetical protein
MRTDSPEKVLEKLATSDNATIVIERQPDGKMRVTSGSWDGENVTFTYVMELSPQFRPPTRCASRSTRDEARRIAANIARLPELMQKI